jgi:hypothetical protein
LNNDDYLPIHTAQPVLSQLRNQGGRCQLVNGDLFQNVLDRNGIFGQVGLHEPTPAVSVSGNWRVIFRFEDNDAVDVNYIDYH